MNVTTLTGVRSPAVEILPWSTMMAPPDKQVSHLQQQIKAESLSEDDPATKLTVTQALQTQLQAVQHQVAQSRASEAHAGPNAGPEAAFRSATGPTPHPGSTLNLKI